MAPPELTWLDQRHLRVGDRDFCCAYPFGPVPAGHLPVMKNRSAVEDYVALARDGRRARIVELGIHSGGSTALLRELFQPERLVALELTPTPVAALTDYITSGGLEEIVRPHYGVDQSDRARLAQILQDELGGEPIDLVVDDASHWYAETLASFEVLFPRLRPGGKLIIEDWNWQHLVATGMRKVRQAGGEAARKQAAAVKEVMARRAAAPEPAQVTFSRLVVELLLAQACGHDVTELVIGPTWVVVERGHTELDPASFRLTDLYHDHFHQLPPPEGSDPR